MNDLIVKSGALGMYFYSNSVPGPNECNVAKYQVSNLLFYAGTIHLYQSYHLR